MARIGMADKLLLEDVFEMRGGYVLAFSNPTFAQFFTDEVGVNIDEARYFASVSSKAKWLRCFLNLAGDKTAEKAIKALWEYRELKLLRGLHPESVEGAQPRVDALLKGLGDGPSAQQPSPARSAGVVVDSAKLGKLKDELLGLHQLAAQERGYAFEAFLKELFDAF